MTLQQHRSAQRYWLNQGVSGLGQDDDSEGPSGQQITSAITGAAAGTIVAANPNLPVTTRIGGGLMAAGGTIALIPGLQLPGAIVAAVGALTSLIGGLFKPDLTKIEATRIVDTIEAQYLKPNLQGWLSLRPDQKTQSVQAASLALVDHALNQVRQGCSNPALGEAGQRCISERLIKGGTAPWCPTSTGCDWITLYRDPIANDPNVIPDPSPSGGITTSGGQGSGILSGNLETPVGSLPAPLLIGGVLIVVALLFMGGD